VYVATGTRCRRSARRASGRPRRTSRRPAAAAGGRRGTSRSASRRRRASSAHAAASAARPSLGSGGAAVRTAGCRALEIRVVGEVVALRRDPAVDLAHRRQARDRVGHFETRASAPSARTRRGSGRRAWPRPARAPTAARRERSPRGRRSRKRVGDLLGLEAERLRQARHRARFVPSRMTVVSVEGSTPRPGGRAAPRRRSPPHHLGRKTLLHCGGSGPRQPPPRRESRSWRTRGRARGDRLAVRSGDECRRRVPPLALASAAGAADDQIAGQTSARLPAAARSSPSSSAAGPFATSHERSRAHVSGRSSAA